MIARAPIADLPVLTHLVGFTTMRERCESLELKDRAFLMTAAALIPFSIRPATRGDVDALDQFIRPFVEQGRLLPRTHDELQELTENGFLAILADRIVGFAALEIYSPKLAELRSLAVSSQYQGQGIGKALVQACLDRAKAQRVFEVLTITSSEDFFQKCGFDFTLPGERKALFHQTREQY